MQITAVFHRKGLRLATGVLLAMLLLAAGFFWYVSDYYRAEDAALDVLASGENIEVQGSLTILSPSYPTDTAIICYPGATVEGDIPHTKQVLMEAIRTVQGRKGQ